MEEKRLLPASKVQPALFIYTGSIIYIVCALLIYSFFISALFVPVEIFILRRAADPFHCGQTVAVNAP